MLASSTSYASGGTTAGAAADSDSAGGSGTASGVAYSVAEGSTGEPWAVGDHVQVSAYIIKNSLQTQTQSLLYS